jgi:O-antigen/teichoic acid export membrane protein
MSQAHGGIRRLGRDTLIYGAGIVLSRAASLIMLPVYTRYLSPADYGVLQLLEMTMDVVAIVLAGGIAAGVLRFYFKFQTEAERRSVFSTSLLMAVGGKLAGALVIFWQAPWLAQVLLDNPGQAELIRIAAVTFVLGDFTSFPLLLMQAKRLPALHSIASVSRLVLQLTLNIWLVVGLGAGVRGILISSLITSSLSGVLLGGWMLRQTGLRVMGEVARDLLRYGIPYKVTGAGTFIVTFGDRFFLKAYQGLASVGLYGLAYQFGFVLVQLSASPFLKAWNPQRFQLAAEPRAVRDPQYNQGFVVLNVMLITLAVAISLFVRPLLTVMSDPEFRSAADMVPIILLAQILAAWTWVVDFGIQVSERTKYVTYATWAGVGVILALYTLLIPRFGGFGAAWATVASFGVRAALSYHWSQKLWPIAYRWKPHLRLLGYGGAAVAVNVVATRGAGFWGQVLIGCSIFATYLALAWIGGVLQRDEQLRLLSTIRSRIRLLPLPNA